MAKVFGNKSYQMVDLFIIPDYKKFYEGCLDTKFSRYAKEEATQLCWRMESVPADRNYPLGVKTMYRAFSTDVSFEIQPCNENDNPVCCLY